MNDVSKVFINFKMEKINHYPILDDPEANLQKALKQSE